MSFFIILVAITLVASAFFWMPMLQSAEAQARRYPRQDPEEVPDLREDDTSPQYTGEIG